MKDRYSENTKFQRGLKRLPIMFLIMALWIMNMTSCKRIDSTDDMLGQLMEDFENNQGLSVVYDTSKELSGTFEAQWQEIYLECEIHEDDFIANNGNVRTVAYMSSDEAWFLQNDQATGFMKPYENDQYMFVALLPKEAENFTGFLEILSTETINTMIDNKDKSIVYANIPIFSLGDPQVAYDWFAVNERGTMPGAVETESDQCMCGIPITTPEKVYLDRAFVYMVMDMESNKPIIMGYVADVGD